jgi:cell division initiation protein
VNVSLDAGADPGSSGGTTEATEADSAEQPPSSVDSSPVDAEAASDAPSDAAGMQVSAQTLRDVKFREKFRGYHPDDVDEFLEQVAEGITYLHGRLREAQDRVGDAEPSGARPIANDEAVRRTLVLAQRTAELAIQEGRHEAERIQSDARTRAESIVSGAEDAARRTVEETNERLRDEVAKLEAARQRLRADVDDLERYLEAQRQQLHASLSDALTRVEQVLPAPALPAPEAAEAEVPPVPWPEPVERSSLWGDSSSTADTAPPLPVEESAETEAPAPLTVAAEVEADAGQPAESEPVRVSSIWSSDPDSDDDGTWATSPAQEPIHDDGDDDPFIAELRRAITDTSPLGPRDDLPGAPPERLDEPVEQEVPGGRRFRRKRR